mgnify:CR=1 FL=1
MLTGTGLLLLVAWHSFRNFISDFRIYRKGTAFQGVCYGLIQRGKEKTTYLQVSWSKENQEYSDEYCALSKPKDFPYPMQVYCLGEETCLGIYSLIYDGFWFLVYFMAGAVSFLTVFQNLWEYLNL